MNKHLLLLVQSAEQAAALPSFAETIRGRYEGIWMLFSPCLLVDEKAASTEHDRNIAALNTAIERCKNSEDFDGAKAYKEKRDAALMERSVRVKESWKTLSESELKAAEDRLLKVFCDAKPAPRIRPEKLKEHYETAQFIDAMNSVRKAWFAPFVPGSFDIAWPSANGASAAAPVDSPALSARKEMEAATSKAANKPDMRKHPRLKALSTMNLIQLGDHATSLGINPNNKNLTSLRFAVLRKEIELGKIPA